MRPLVLFLAALGIPMAGVSCSSLVTPFSSAKIVQQPGGSGMIAASGGMVHRYRINGLQQMSIFLDPQRGSFLSRNPQDSFTQEELSKLRIKATSLSGKLDVNGLKIDLNQTLVIDLRKRFDLYGGGEVMDYGKYVPVIRFVSYNNVPADQNLCDFILTIEDTEGITRTTGLTVHGGFTDSL